MTSLNLVRQANATVRKQRPKMVAVFVGGTSGIGEATAKELAKTVHAPTVYIVGRNQEAGSRILADCQGLNPHGTYRFIKSDVSLLREVDTACQEIQSKEAAVDLLFMTPGHLATRKNNTAEGLDDNHVLRYYARMRFIQNLIPQLQAAELPARVLTILAAGKEGEIDESNFDLQANWSFGTAAVYGATLNSLAIEYLASQYTSISFIHVFPGLVRTSLMKSSFGSLLGSVIGLLTRLLSISEQESGERNIFLATSMAYAPVAYAGDATSKQVHVATASTGEAGGGSYLLNYDGTDATNKTLMADYRARNYPKKVWEHTLGVFQRTLGADS
ncbi:hypothetical protein BDV27DRAFT_132054 [Aspergillus caelatus]|uniref:Short-chain dehydrogenases/reductase n=1 Tax=Aspergillus caelatus TaxID=61420 RepID=A0A5N6ZX66_9EURO|nr:uncharacterized protein BDV27DRAFT_132054 [Aspergillus caelatus]KAE8362112.1 hypothetical protein BDV27DRAFT_132054 [Aspergillus caelatus]